MSADALDNAMIIASLLSIILLALAILHVLWGIGFWFPIEDEAQLVRTVAGFSGAEEMPGAVPCALVAVALFMAVTCLWWPPGPFRFLTLVVIGALFLARGLAAFTPFWRRMAPAEPFATLDRKYYGPLCVALGLGFWISL